MSKLTTDFGVTALLGTIVLVGAFIAIIIGVVKGSLGFNELLPILGGWVMGVLSAYSIIKAKKS